LRERFCVGGNEIRKESLRANRVGVIAGSLNKRDVSTVKKGRNGAFGYLVFERCLADVEITLAD
jgi:hypothetical protein